MSESTPSESTPPEPLPPFEESLSELQSIVADLEDGALGLEPSLARFEHGIRLLRHCYATLEQAEQKIELLVRIDPAGQPVTAPFDASATFDTSESTPKKATRRRTPAAASPKTNAETPAAGKPPAASATPVTPTAPADTPPAALTDPRDEEPPFDINPAPGKRLF